MITGERDETGRNTFYQPIIYPNDFWHLRTFELTHSHLCNNLTLFLGEQEVELNATYPTDSKEKLIVPLSVTFHPMSWTKMQIYATLGHGFEEAAKTV